MTALPRLLVLTQPTVPLASLVQGVRELSELGAKVAVIHRHPQANVRTYLHEARALQAACGGKLPFFVHGRLDVALLLGAHLHLPVEAPSPLEVRPLLAAGILVSTSAHDAHELARAPGADWVLLSPVFRPTSKAGDTRPPLGVEGFRALASHSPVPAYALGGLTAESLRRLGPIPGIAVLGGIWNGESRPVDVARRMLEALEASSSGIVAR